ncbi:MAG: hypothetical protein HUK25_08165, partial [Treponema sp.]|nr:hypothetical protein [Treponema sp.]
MTELILAGARSVFGLSELKSAFSLLGFNVSFIDAPFMADVLIHEFPETEKILFTTSIPENSVLVPLSEYWISRCIQGSSCRISEAALKACRSKLFLYQFMAEKG